MLKDSIQQEGAGIFGSYLSGMQYGCAMGADCVFSILHVPIHDTGQDQQIWYREQNVVVNKVIV